MFNTFLCSGRSSILIALNTSHHTVKMPTESNRSLLAASHHYSPRSPSIAGAPSTRSLDAGFFPVELDDNIVGDPSQRINFRPFCQDPSYGSLPPPFQNPEIQCTCPLFLTAPSADTPATACGKHDVPSLASVSDQQTPDHNTNRSGEGHSQKRKCMSADDVRNVGANCQQYRVFRLPHLSLSRRRRPLLDSALWLGDWTRNQRRVLWIIRRLRLRILSRERLEVMRMMEIM